MYVLRHVTTHPQYQGLSLSGNEPSTFRFWDICFTRRGFHTQVAFFQLMSMCKISIQFNPLDYKPHTSSYVSLRHTTTFYVYISNMQTHNDYINTDKYFHTYLVFNYCMLVYDGWVNHPNQQWDNPRKRKHCTKTIYLGTNSTVNDD